MISQKIKHITITKLWGVKTISTDLKDDVNIFIGTNGSSKTTFLNLIEATLLVDINMFSIIDFEKISIELEPSKTSNISFIEVTKRVSEDTPIISYSFDKQSEIEIPCSDYLVQRSYRMPMRYRESLLMIKEKLINVVSISWLSINRDNINTEDLDRRELLERFKSMVDIKLQELVRGLIMYQLQLESEANKLSDKFKEDVMSLMLYDKDIDSFESSIIERIGDVDTKQMRSDLYRAFNALGVARDKSAAINMHIERINGVIEKITHRSFEIQDIHILSLLKRTLSIIEITKAHELQKNEIFTPIDNFWEYLNYFMSSKKFFLNKEGQGGLDIIVREYTRETSINITSLSSGEKQLFILLTEALLQRNKPYLFIADEPELSLHIGWQKEILKEILKLNPNAQIIVATHSPEVASSFPNRVINMKTITRYE